MLKLAAYAHWMLTYSDKKYSVVNMQARYISNYFIPVSNSNRNSQMSKVTVQSSLKPGFHSNAIACVACVACVA